MDKTQPQKELFRKSIKVIILFGLIAMFGDMVYESMRGSSGQFMCRLRIKGECISVFSQKMYIIGGI